jgi:hypothetical protein
MFSSSCTGSCEADDYECDDCFERFTMWDPQSICIPSRTCPNAPTDPCTVAGTTTYMQSRGYRKIPYDTCTSDDNDRWAPKQMACDHGHTQTTPAPTTVTTPQPPPTTTTTKATTTTRHQITTPPQQQVTTPPQQQQTTPSPTTPAESGGGHMGIVIAVAVGLIIVASLVIGFLVLRRNAGFQTLVATRFAGRVPVWLVPSPESPYATLGELQTNDPEDEG